MAVKMKTVVTYRAKAACPTHSRTEIPVRDLQVIIDEPTERDGTNLGPSPTEAAMTALIACTNVIGHKNAKRLGIDLGPFLKSRSRSTASHRPAKKSWIWSGLRPRNTVPSQSCSALRVPI